MPPAHRPEPRGLEGEAGARRERARLRRAEARPQARPRGLAPHRGFASEGGSGEEQPEGPGPTRFLGRFFTVGHFINKNVRNLHCRSVPFLAGLGQVCVSLGAATAPLFSLFATRSLSFAGLPHPGASGRRAGGLRQISSGTASPTERRLSYVKRVPRLFAEPK